MTEHDVLVGFRLRLFTLAEELGNVSADCRQMGVDRSTYYRWKHKVDRCGLEALRVRERRPERRASCPLRCAALRCSSCLRRPYEVTPRGL